MKKEYTADELFEKYQRIRNETSDERFFNGPEHTKTQELWCAVHFSKGYSAHIKSSTIIMDDSDTQLDYDFELKVAGKLYPMQITECMEPDRRRGDEYKEVNPGITKDDSEYGNANAHIWVKNTIEKKFTKYFAGCRELNLLVYLNFSALEQRYDILTEHCADIAKNFNSVWLLNGNALCCIKSCEELGELNGWGMVEESLVNEGL
jgi:hypothetical protein